MAAWRVYHTCTTTLAYELGVEPGPATRNVYEHLLNLETPPPAVAMLRSASLLVGRDDVWAKLQEAWRQAMRGHPTFALVVGEAGIGKTRLVEEMVEWGNPAGNRHRGCSLLCGWWTVGVCPRAGMGAGCRFSGGRRKR